MPRKWRNSIVSREINQQSSEWSHYLFSFFMYLREGAQSVSCKGKYGLTFWKIKSSDSLESIEGFKQVYFSQHWIFVWVKHYIGICLNRMCYRYYIKPPILLIFWSSSSFLNKNIQWRHLSGPYTSNNHHLACVWVRDEGPCQSAFCLWYNSQWAYWMTTQNIQHALSRLIHALSRLMQVLRQKTVTRWEKVSH